VVGEAFVVTQHKHRALPFAERPERGPQLRLIGGPVFRAPGRGPFGHRVGHDLGTAAQPASADVLVDHRTAQVGVPVLRRETAMAYRLVDAQQRFLHQILRRCGIMGQLIRHTQQPVTGMLDQLRQYIVQMHVTTSGLP